MTAYAVPFITETLLYAGWQALEWDYAKILTIVVVIEAAFPISGWLIELMHLIMPSAKRRQKQEIKQ